MNKMAFGKIFLTVMFSTVTVTAVVRADSIGIRDFEFQYNGVSVFRDSFDDGYIPAIPMYREVKGGMGMTETNGILIMDTELAPNFLGGTQQVLLAAGGSGFVQGVFSDTALSNGAMISIELGNSDYGGVWFGVGNHNNSYIALTSQYMGGGGDVEIEYFDNRPVLGFTGQGIVTLRLGISDFDINDGKVEVIPMYWFGSSAMTSLPTIYLPLESLAYYPGYPASFGSFKLDNSDFDSAPVPEPSSVFLFGSGIVGYIGNRLRKRNSRYC